MTILTDRLELRSSQIDFAEMAAAYYLRNADFLAQYEPLREPAFYTKEGQLKILQQEILQEKERTGIAFYLFLKDNPGQIAGKINLNNIVWGGFCSCFLGYKMEERLINSGYMTEAVSATAACAFDTLHLHRIEANVMPRNLRSLRVLEKCGFENEGMSRKYLKIGGVWEDHIHMVKLNEKIE